jgi:hypothetical protein
LWVNSQQEKSKHSMVADFYRKPMSTLIRKS